MKINKTSLAFSLLALFLLIITVAFLCFKFIRSNNFITNSLIIVEEKDTSKFDSNNMGPINDDQATKISPYSFSVRNAGTKAADYELLLEDVINKDSDKKILTRNYLKYQLSINSEVIGTGLLSDVKNNVIDNRTIKKNEIIKYDLKIWITGDIDDNSWMNKYYNYRLLASSL